MYIFVAQRIVPHASCVFQKTTETTGYVKLIGVNIEFLAGFCTDQVEKYQFYHFSTYVAR